MNMMKSVVFASALFCSVFVVPSNSEPVVKTASQATKAKPRVAFNVDNPGAKTWDKGTPIGYGPDENGNMVNRLKVKSTYGFPETSDYFSVEKARIAMRPGTAVTLKVWGAVDYDHWRIGEAEGTAEDVLIQPTYSWRCLPNEGSFHFEYERLFANGTEVQWFAPNRTGVFKVWCRIDDQPLQPAADETGSRNDDALEVEFQIAVTEMSAQMKVLQVRRANGTVPEQIIDPEGNHVFGGLCEAALELNLGPALKYKWPTGITEPGNNARTVPAMRMRLDEIKIIDNVETNFHDGEPEGPSAREFIHDESYGASRWEHYRTDLNGWKMPNTPEEPGAYGQYPQSGLEASRWRLRTRWNTAILNRASYTNPEGQSRYVFNLRGHNGLHKLSLVSTDPTDPNINYMTDGTHPLKQQAVVVFPDGQSDGQIFTTSTVTSKTFDVQNTVITRCEAHDKDESGATTFNKDYLKFDPDSTDELRRNPKISFKIEDRGADKNRYRWFLDIKRTNEEQNFIQMSGIMNQPGEKTVTIKSEFLPGDSLLDYTQSIPIGEWGTYTFELRVEEIEVGQVRGLGEELQVSRSRHLGFAAFMPNTYDEDNQQRKGHYIEFKQNDDDPDPLHIKVFGGYYLQPEYSTLDAKEVKIDLLDANFTTLFSVTRTQGDEVRKEWPYTNLFLYTLSDDERLDRFRGVYAAVDKHAMEYRDHQDKRTWATNDAHQGNYFHVEDDAMEPTNRNTLLTCEAFSVTAEEKLIQCFQQAYWQVLTKRNDPKDVKPLHCKHLGISDLSQRRDSESNDLWSDVTARTPADPIPQNPSEYRLVFKNEEHLGPFSRSFFHYWASRNHKTPGQPDQHYVHLMGATRGTTVVYKKDADGKFLLNEDGEKIKDTAYPDGKPVGGIADKFYQTDGVNEDPRWSYVFVQDYYERIRGASQLDDTEFLMKVMVHEVAHQLVPNFNSKLGAHQHGYDPTVLDEATAKERKAYNDRDMDSLPFYRPTVLRNGAYSDPALNDPWVIGRDGYALCVMEYKEPRSHYLCRMHRKGKNPTAIDAEAVAGVEKYEWK